MKRQGMFLLLLPNLALSQNLVPNPSFESTSGCHTGYSGVGLTCTDWVNADAAGSPDYFNECAINTVVGIPQNSFGYQRAKSCQAYTGFYGYNSNVFYRESIGVALKEPMTPGKKYYVKLFFSKGEHTKYAIDKIGVLFSTTHYNSNSGAPAPVANFAHVWNSNVVFDTTWVELRGSIIADSAYSFISIGNFFDDNNTTAILTPNPYSDSYSYYYVDDVCVSTDSMYTELWNMHPIDSLICCGDKFSLIGANVFTPNKDGYNDVFKPLGPIQGGDIYPAVTDSPLYSLKIFNRWGQNIFSTSEPGEGWNGISLNGKPGSEGIYYWLIELTHPCMNSKTLRLNGFVHLFR